MITSSGCWSGAGGMACAEDAKARAKATTISLIIASLPLVHSHTRLSRLSFFTGQLAMRWHRCNSAESENLPQSGQTLKLDGEGTEERCGSLSYRYRVQRDPAAQLAKGDVRI